VFFNSLLSRKEQIIHPFNASLFAEQY
jgi:hypothetical protein